MTLDTKIKPPVLAPADATQAMSNWVLKPEAWMEVAKKSDNTVARFACRHETILIRIGVATIAMVSACMDSYYNAVWFSIKAVIISTRGTIQFLTLNKWGHFCEDVTRQHLGIHLYKAVAFFCSIFCAPFVGLAAPERLVAAYRKREMIITEKEKSLWETALAKIKDTGEVVLNAAKEIPPIVLKHPVETAGAVFLTALAAGAAIHLHKVNRRVGALWRD